MSRATREHPARPVQLGPQVPRATRALPVPLELLVPPALPEWMELPVPQVRKVSSGWTGQRAPLAPLARLVLRGLMARTELPAPQVPLELTVRMGRLASRATPEPLVLPAQQDRLVL